MIPETSIDTPYAARLSPDKFNQAVLAWFDVHGRKNLPWQLNKTPYRVWVSEIMLQQTQVNTVIPYYERFMDKFPDVRTLANASIDEVLSHWAGLGYYARGRNLHKAAQQVVSEHNSQFPDTLSKLESLAGIGRSTAAAIRSIAFGKHAAILDGNVKRVLCRFQGVKEWPGTTKVTNALWTLAEHYAPNERSADYTQAMMDLGATLCSRSSPKCTLCPLSFHCVSNQKGLQKEIPAPKPKKEKPEKFCWMLILLDQRGRILLQKRPPSGIWGGLWSLVQLEKSIPLESIEEHTQSQFGLKAEIENVMDEFRHTFSHYHLHISPVVLRQGSSANEMPLSSVIKDSGSEKWFTIKEIEETGIPSPVQKILGKLQGS